MREVRRDGAVCAFALTLDGEDRAWTEVSGRRHRMIRELLIKDETILLC